MKYGGNINQLLNKETELVFAIHNESKTKNKYPNVKSIDVKRVKYKFDTTQNVESSLEHIVEELYSLVKENDSKIDAQL